MSASQIIDDGIWCTIFPTIPCLVRYAGLHDRTYIGYAAEDKSIRVAQLDHASGLIDEFFLAGAANANDHNSATVFILDDGRILVMWSYHASSGNGFGGNTSIRYRVTAQPEDLSTLGPTQTINHGVRCAYSQVFQREDGRVGVFSRVGSSTSNETWVLSHSEDLNTWTTQTVWSPEGNRLYQLLREKEGGGHWIGLHTHPERGGNQRLYIATFDEDTGEIRHGSTNALIGNAYSGESLPSTWDTAQTLLETVGAEHTRLHDLNRWGDAVVGRWESDYFGDYILLRRQGDGTYAEEVIAPTGAMVHSGNGYVGDATFSFENRDRLWLSREEAGVWRIYQYDRTGSGWDVVEVSTRTNPALRFRPRAVENAHPSFVVGWNETARYDGLADWGGSEIWGAPLAASIDPDATATFRAAPSEPLTFYAAGALNEEPEAPNAAPTVTLTPASQTALSLSLSEVDGATGYRYRVGTSGSWTDLGGGRTAQITGLTPGTSYTVQARAYNAAGDGPIGSATASTMALEVHASGESVSHTAAVGALARSIHLSAVSASATSATVQADASIRLSATATVTTSASAGLRRRVQPVGITEVTSSASGTLVRRVRTHSRAATYTGATGAILRAVRVVGSARGASAAHATLSVGDPLPHPTTLGVTIEDIYTLRVTIEDIYTLAAIIED